MKKLLIVVSALLLFSCAGVKKPEPHEVEVAVRNMYLNEIIYQAVGRMLVWEDENKIVLEAYNELDQKISDKVFSGSYYGVEIRREYK